MAAAGFDVPIALITLLDAQRQWFKSRVRIGDAGKAQREEFFCAHAIVGRDVFVVPGCSPSMIVLPRIRWCRDRPAFAFMPGRPLILSGGTCIGTLCIIDRRPRDLDLQRLALLKDLADLAVEELERAHPPVEISNPHEPAMTTGNAHPVAEPGDLWLLGRHRLLCGDSTVATDVDPLPSFFNRGIEPAAASLGMTVTLAPVHDDAAIEEAIAAQAREPGGGLIMFAGQF